MITLILVTFGLLFLHSIDTIAQQPHTEWNQRYNSPGNFNEDLIDMALDKNGNIYLTGNSGAPSDIITLKYDNQGNLLWSRTYNGQSNGEDKTAKIFADNSGFVYVGGRTFNQMEFSSNYLILKYNSAGDLVWIREFSNQDSTVDAPTDMEIDNESNIYITGSGYKCFLCKSEYLTVKYNRTGDLLWKRFFQNSGGYSEFAYSIDLSSTNRISVTGRSSDDNGNFLAATLIYNSSGDSLSKSILTNSVGNRVESDFSDNLYVGGFRRENNQDDICLSKYDSTGKLIWASIYNTQNSFYRNDYFSWMALDKENQNIYLTGNSEYNGEAGWEYLLLKYDLAGDTVWKKGYSPVAHSDNVSKFLSVDKFNNIYITGKSDFSTSFYRFLTIKYDSAGNFRWSTNYTNYLFANHEAKKVLVDTSNSVFVAGTSYDFQNGTNDIVLVKYSQMTNSNNPFTIVHKEFKLNQNFPNPFNPKTIITYQLPLNSFVIIKIYDISGAETCTIVNERKDAGNYSVEFDGSNYSSGAYFYQMVSDKSLIDTKKFILIK